MGAIVSRVEKAGQAVSRLEPSVNALITPSIESAHGDARHQEARDDGGLLAGMTLMIKDNIDTAGVRTTSGSKFFADHVPNRDAPVVARLRRAGALVLGKATMHEFAFGIRSHNSVSGQCHNPWDLTRVPGGSSGGSAAAVAANYCIGALGSDTGGSVRLPASFCGISGLRPTVGRVPNLGSTPVCPSQDTIGPMARSVSDVAKLFAVIASPGGNDSGLPRLHNFLPAIDGGVSGLKIGIPRNMYFDGIDASIAAQIESATSHLESLGARLVDIDVPGVEKMHEWATVVIFSDACEVHAQRLAESPEKFDTQVRERMTVGLTYRAVDYAHAMRQRERWRERLAHVFSEVDVLLSPTVHTPVPEIDDNKSLLQATKDATRNTYAGAFGQIPGLSIPCGFSADGLPVGLQLEAKWWDEPTLLRVGRAFQRDTDWHLRVAPNAAELIT